MGRRSILPFGRWGPAILGVLGLGLLAWGAFTGDREMLVVGAICAAALLIAFPVAESLLGRSHPDDPEN